MKGFFKSFGPTIAKGNKKDIKPKKEKEAFQVC